MRRTSPWSAPTVLKTSNRQGYFGALFVTTHPSPDHSNHTIPHPRRWDAWARQFSKVDDPCFLPLQDGFAEHQYSNLKKIVGPGGPTPWLACQSEDTRQQKELDWFTQIYHIVIWIWISHDISSLFPSKIRFCHTFPPWPTLGPQLPAPPPPTRPVSAVPPRCQRCPTRRWPIFPQVLAGEQCQWTAGS